MLREAGLEVGPGRIADALAALEEVDIGRPDDTYWALRTTLVTRFEEIEPFDRAFDAWFLGAPVVPPTRVRVARLGRSRPGGRADPIRGGERETESDRLRAGWSATEALRHRDFAAMTPEEFARAREVMTKLATVRPRRSSRRLRSHPRGRTLDLRALARRSLATGGEPIAPGFRRRVEVPRRLVILCDISGSMEAYSRGLLLFMHAAVGAGRVEVFAFGTQLTRLTSELRTRDPEQALNAAATSVLDWASGTLIGASLQRFNDEWGRRALSRGAVVVIVSDGWERQDAALVGREMARLERSAYAVIWVSPLKGKVDYEPLGAGIRAALPHVDRFLAGHNIASLEELAGVLSGINRRHAG
ncbi:MAG: VWA domain-containing protein [Solirubrobacterales bacterium]|nr:VWA domain-containing protein [Solirubrobacterales bacterium]